MTGSRRGQAWLAALALATCCCQVHAGNLLLAQRLRSGEEVCQPWAVPAEDRCSYVIEHRDICYPDGGLQAYIRIHYCDLGHW